MMPNNGLLPCNGPCNRTSKNLHFGAFQLLFAFPVLEHKKPRNSLSCGALRVVHPKGLEPLTF
jgi:hypothetical protein